MKNVLISGIPYNKEDAKYMMEVMKMHGIKDLYDYGSYDTFKNSKGVKLEKELNDRFVEITNGEKANIICHSSGCNLGLLLASYDSNAINKLILLSPNYNINLGNNFFLYERIKKLSSERISFVNAKSYILYSVKDRKISPCEAFILASQLYGKYDIFYTKKHNLLMSNARNIVDNDICDFLYPNKVKSIKI